MTSVKNAGEWPAESMPRPIAANDPGTMPERVDRVPSER